MSASIAEATRQVWDRIDIEHAESIANPRRASTGRLPAYGKRIMQMRRSGMVPNPPQIYVCLDCWDWRKGPGRVVVAHNQDAGALDYRFVAGLDVFMVYDPFLTFTERRDALIRALVRARPLRLYVIDAQDYQRNFWVVSQQVGLERQEYA